MTWLETASKITPSSKMASTPKRTKVPLIPHIDSHPMLFTEDLEKSWVDVYTPGYGSSIDEIPIRVRECKQLEKLSQEVRILRLLLWLLLIHSRSTPLALFFSGKKIQTVVS
jgi:hypothetical protein